MIDLDNPTLINRDPDRIELPTSFPWIEQSPKPTNVKDWANVETVSHAFIDYSLTKEKPEYSVRFIDIGNIYPPIPRSSLIAILKFEELPLYAVIDRLSLSGATKFVAESFVEDILQLDKDNQTYLESMSWTDFKKLKIIFGNPFTFSDNIIKEFEVNATIIGING